MPDIDKDRYIFRIGDVFPAEDPVARFLVSLSTGLNDLLFVNRLLVPDPHWGLLRREATPEENIFLLRQGLSAVWELLLLFRESSKPVTIRGEEVGPSAVATFLVALPPPARQFVDLLRGFDDPESKFRRTAAQVRNHTWHYPPPGSKELRRALKARASDLGVLELGEKMPSIRANFADLVALEHLTRFIGDDCEALAELFRALADATTAFVHLAQYALDAWLAKLPEDVVRRYGAGDPFPPDVEAELNGRDHSAAT